MSLDHHTTYLIYTELLSTHRVEDTLLKRILKIMGLVFTE
jgi:hypothetical protein